MADRDLLERFFALGDFEIGEKVQHLLIDTFDTALMDGNTDQRVYNALCHRKYMESVFQGISAKICLICCFTVFLYDQPRDIVIIAVDYLVEF